MVPWSPGPVVPFIISSGRSAGRLAEESGGIPPHRTEDLSERSSARWNILQQDFASRFARLVSVSHRYLIGIASYRGPVDPWTRGPVDPEFVDPELVDPELVDPELVDPELVESSIECIESSIEYGLESYSIE